MPKSRSHRTRRTRSQWTGVFERFASSQLGPREFCQRERLSLSSFQRCELRSEHLYLRRGLASKLPVKSNRRRPGRTRPSPCPYQ